MKIDTKTFRNVYSDDFYIARNRPGFNPFYLDNGDFVKERHVTAIFYMSEAYNYIVEFSILDKILSKTNYIYTNVLTNKIYSSDDCPNYKNIIGYLASKSLTGSAAEHAANLVFNGLFLHSEEMKIYLPVVCGENSSDNINSYKY